VLIPLCILGALAVVLRPRLLDRYGILLCAVAIVAMASIFLSMEAGGALSGALHLQGQAAALISKHSFAAKILAIVFTALTATLILSFSAWRIGAGGRPTGLSVADSILRTRWAWQLLRIGLVVFSLVAAYYVFRVGDLGAKAVWLGRLQQH
jgi:hypothetical protein